MADEVVEAPKEEAQGAEQQPKDDFDLKKVDFLSEPTKEEPAPGDAVDTSEVKSEVKDEFSELAPDSTVPEEEYEGPVEEINLKLPPGLKPDNPELVDFVKMIKDSGTKPEHAQKFLDMYLGKQRQIMDTYIKADVKFREQQNKKWIDENLKDSEFGGKNYASSSNYVTAALRKFIPKNELMSTMDKDGKMGFLEMMQMGNLKNCPPLFRFIARVGKYVAEAQPVTTDASSDKKEKPFSHKEALFKEFM